MEIDELLESEDKRAENRGTLPQFSCFVWDIRHATERNTSQNLLCILTKSRQELHNWFRSAVMCKSFIHIYVVGCIDHSTSTLAAGNKLASCSATPSPSLLLDLL